MECFLEDKKLAQEKMIGYDLPGNLGVSDNLLEENKIKPKNMGVK